MATITQKKKGGKWIAIYTDASGKQRWKTGYTDKAETQRLANRLEDEQRRIRIGDIDPQAETRRLERAKPIDRHVADYRTAMEAAGRNAGTVAYVMGDIAALIAFAVASGTPLTSASEIDRPLIDRWQHDQQKQQRAKVKGNSNKTINRRIGSVQQFLKHLNEHGGVTAYVLKRYPKLPTSEHHKTRQAANLSPEQTQKLLTCSDIPEDRRQRYLVAVRSGLRMNELRQLEGRHFAIKDKLIHVPAHIAKAKTDQSIPMHKSIAKIVGAMIDQHGTTTPLFKMPTKQHVINQIRTDAKAAGIVADGLGFHALRHTFCTTLARSDVHPALLQRLARHQDLKTTLNYYVHLKRKDEQAAIDTL